MLCEKKAKKKKFNGEWQKSPLRGFVFGRSGNRNNLLRLGNVDSGMDTELSDEERLDRIAQNNMGTCKPEGANGYGGVSSQSTRGWCHARS